MNDFKMLNNTQMNILALLSILLISACTDKSVSSNPGVFTKEEIAGYTFEDINKKVIGVYSFSTDGNVTATIGTADGPLAAPVLRWDIDKYGRLVLDYGYFMRIWTKVSKKRNLYRIKNDFSLGIREPEKKYCLITRTNRADFNNITYSNVSFSEEELSGSTLIFGFLSLIPHYMIFQPSGYGIQNQKEKFRWSVDSKGIVKETEDSGRVYLWKKLSRVNDKIEFESTDVTVEKPEPPLIETYKRIKTQKENKLK